jgi:hypothetical protein
VLAVATSASNKLEIATLIEMNLAVLQDMMLPFKKGAFRR